MFINMSFHHFLKAYMSTRPRFEMRRFLTAWNIMLAAFSIFGFARTLPEFLHVLFSIPRGMYHSVCSSRYTINDNLHKKGNTF